jgi:TonB-dependent Receptor Plug Domain
MERNYRVALAVRRALIMSAVAAAGAAPALAQENLGKVVVTGSRIRSPNLEATTRVTQVTAADVVTQGVTRIEDRVNQLPQAFAAQNVTVANGATGTATLNLRGLGAPRTLVLIDGRRMPYGGVTDSAADINQIPTQMIERVDVLTEHEVRVPECEVGFSVGAGFRIPMARRIVPLNLCAAHAVLAAPDQPFAFRVRRKSFDCADQGRSRQRPCGRRASPARDIHLAPDCVPFRARVAREALQLAL